MPAAKSYRVKLPNRFGSKSLGKAKTETGLKTIYNRVRSKYPNDVIRIVAPDGRRRNIKPGSGLEERVQGSVEEKRTRRGTSSRKKAITVRLLPTMDPRRVVDHIRKIQGYRANIVDDSPDGATITTTAPRSKLKGFIRGRYN